MDEITIREMREDDVPHILTIENASFSTPWTEAAFLHEIHKPYALNLVLLVDNRLAGYLCLNFVFDEGHILNLAVHSDFRRKGLATWLMQDGLIELKQKGCRFIYLEVRVSNQAAQSFYERFGFKTVGLRIKYYANPIEDAVLMMREL